MAAIRKATRADISGMHRVRLAVRENVLSLPTRISEADYVTSIEVHGRGWVIECDGQIVAFAVGFVSDGSIWALFVDPDHEGRGYGTMLHSTMIEWLGACGLDHLWLTTAPDSRAAGFYTALGWQRVGITEDGEARFEYDLS